MSLNLFEDCALLSNLVSKGLCDINDIKALMQTANSLKPPSDQFFGPPVQKQWPIFSYVGFRGHTAQSKLLRHDGEMFLINICAFLNSSSTNPALRKDSV